MKTRYVFKARLNTERFFYFQRLNEEARRGGGHIITERDGKRYDFEISGGEMKPIGGMQVAFTFTGDEQPVRRPVQPVFTGVGGKLADKAELAAPILAHT